ncbi:adenosylcobinamide-GDP ribazoletransferase [Oscillospiraceae bacterium PP1C4]
MKRLLSSLNIAFSMYSTIPMPRVDWDKENMRYIMCFFPMVGIVIGGAVYGWLWMAATIGLGKILTAVITTIIPVAITGGIHLDGLCDTVDALASHAPMERKLEILKDPHVGAFALIGCNLYLLLMFGLWTQYVFDPQTAAVLACGFVLSRALSGISVVSFRCAKRSGLAATFSDAAHKKQVRAALIVYVLCCIALMLSISLFVGAGCLVAAVVAICYYKWMAYRTFGGITGDLAGYFLQLCEIMMLAAAVICGGVL